jgi:hypothetical protein
MKDEKCEKQLKTIKPGSIKLTKGIQEKMPKRFGSGA